jgi:hypothetical protein
LAKGGEVREACTDRARPSIERGVVLAVRLVEVLRIERELVPEPVEIDAFATGNQTLHVGATEAKLPHTRVLNNLFPGPNSRKWCINWHESSHSIGGCGGEGVANHVADVVSDKIGTCHADSVHHSSYITTLCFLVIASRWPGGEAKPAQIGHDDGMVCDERSRQWCPHVAGRTKTMQQHDRRALTPDSGVDRCAICLNLSSFEGSREKYQIVSSVDEFHFVPQF